MWSGGQRSHVRRALNVVRCWKRVAMHALWRTQSLFFSAQMHKMTVKNVSYLCGGFIALWKKNTLCGDQCPSLCDLTSATNPFVGFPSNLAWVSFTDCCWTSMSFVKIDWVTVLLYVRAWVNFRPTFRSYWMYVDEIPYAVKHVRFSWKWAQWNPCFTEVHKWNFTLFCLFIVPF